MQPAFRQALESFKDKLEAEKAEERKAAERKTEEAERRSKIVTFSQQRAIEAAMDARDVREESAAPPPPTEEEAAQLERIR